MRSKKSRKDKGKKKGFGVKATVIAEKMAEYTAKYNKWRMDIFKEYIEQNADPKIEGEITDKKLEEAGIKICTNGLESWLEQDGKAISKVLKPKPFEFDFSPYDN